MDHAYSKLIPLTVSILLDHEAAGLCPGPQAVGSLPGDSRNCKRVCMIIIANLDCTVTNPCLTFIVSYSFLSCLMCRWTFTSLCSAFANLNQRADAIGTLQSHWTRLTAFVSNSSSISRCLKMSQGVSRCLKMSQDVSRYLQHHMAWAEAAFPALGA